MSWRSFRALARHWCRRRSVLELPRHLRRGQMGELAARRYLEAQGLRFLVANFRSKRGEIDLVFQSEHGLVFVEVKTRAVQGWTRPAAAVNRAKRLCLTRAALDYLHALHNPKVGFRFDIVEVLLDEETLAELRHIPNAFTLSKPYRYG